MAEPIKCKNCGAPIKRLALDKWLALEGFEEPTGFWKHIRDAHAGYIWCYPKADQELREFKFAAEPEGNSNGR